VRENRWGQLQDQPRDAEKKLAHERSRRISDAINNR
jgi:hypothetical protein